MRGFVAHTMAFISAVRRIGTPVGEPLQATRERDAARIREEPHAGEREGAEADA